MKLQRSISSWFSFYLLVVICLLFFGSPFLNLAYAQDEGVCPGFESYLIGESEARVSYSLDVPLRQDIGLDGQVISQIPSQSVVKIITGPLCESNFTWWVVEYEGTTGWVFEGNDSSRFFEPSSWMTQCTRFPSRLAIGQSGKVIFSSAMDVTAKPSLSSQIAGNLSTGTTFQVVEGPICSENYLWWKVSSQGTVGWLIEGREETYWLEPVDATESTYSPKPVSTIQKIKDTVTGILIIFCGVPIGFAVFFAVLSGMLQSDNSETYEVTIKRKK